MKFNTLCHIIAGVLLVALSSFAEEGTATISDFLFRYDFTKGTKVYEHNGCETEPCTKGVSYDRQEWRILWRFGIIRPSIKWKINLPLYKFEL